MKIFKRHKDKGFTLVELIVTIAIMTIVGGAIASFLVVSQRQYNNGVAETSVQYDAQLVSNQIHDLLIDAQKGVSYGYVGRLAEGAEESEEAPSGLVINDADIDVTDLDSKQLYVYNKDKYYRIRWAVEEKRIYFAEAARGTSITTEALLAEFVTDFSVDLSELLEKKTIRYRITLLKEESGREYTTTHSVKLRNDILVNASEGEIYVPEPPPVEATGIDVYPESVSIWPGEYEQLAARVTSNVGLMPSQEVAWLFQAVPGGESPITDTATRFEEDTLFLGGTEAGRVIDGEPHRINVYATQAATGLVSDSVKVGVRTITEVDANVSIGETEYTNDSVSVVAGQEGLSIAVVAFGGHHIGDLCTDDMEETIANMGDITIEVDGGEYLVLENSTEEAERTGNLKFAVQDVIDFGTEESVIATVKVFCNRAPYTEVSDTITIIINKRDMPPLIDVSQGWKRNGVLNIDLSALNVQRYGTNENGEWIGGQWIEVFVDFYDSEWNVKSHGHYGDQGGHDRDNDSEYNGYVVQEQAGTPCELLFHSYYTVENPQDVKLRWKASESSYSDIYFDQYGNPYSLAYAKITVRHCFSSGASVDYGPYTVEIEPVNFEYSLDGISQSAWDSSGNMTLYAAPSVEADNYATYNGHYNGAANLGLESYKTYRTYYRLTGGWHVSAAESVDDYLVNDEHFVCMIDGKAGYVIQTGAYSYENRYYTKNAYAGVAGHEGYMDVTSGKDSNGYYIEVKVPDSLNQYYAERGSTMTVVYEGNWAAGLGGYYETDNFRSMNGCKYAFKVKFVEDNLEERYIAYERVWDRWHYVYKPVEHTLSNLPSTQFCPSQSELKSQGYGNNMYFYISPTERYYLRTIQTGYREVFYITYEKYTTTSVLAGIKRWVPQWKDSNGLKIWYSYSISDQEWQYSSTRISN